MGFNRRRRLGVTVGENLIVWNSSVNPGGVW